MRSVYFFWKALTLKVLEQRDNFAYQMMREVLPLLEHMERMRFAFLRQYTTDRTRMAHVAPRFAHAQRRFSALAKQYQQLLVLGNRQDLAIRNLFRQAGPDGWREAIWGVLSKGGSPSRVYTPL